MRTPLVAGNWKCHLRLDSARALASSLRDGLQGLLGVEVVVCPTFLHILPVRDVLAGSSIGLGAQDTHWEDDVAATGEVGPAMLAEAVQYVIIGHSERRHVFGESDEAVRRKLEAALAQGLRPILCVGETLQERARGHTHAVLERQTRSALEGLGRADGLVVAYEPVWAIGTGVAATAHQAAEAIAFVRQLIARYLGERAAEETRILYGGSVSPANIAEFVSLQDVDGALVGGASLKADAFVQIVQATAQAKKGGR
ncbi:MAG: triose-phosphate isomerase [Dehalococcoidia bacterium]|jgi:triosephosphate isomerase|nr:triose-phosphate isomerase [Dehalococcoidia bacterium]MDW8008727.1 triose-phosphate isomerase [Chloroflexota bacterium]